MLKSPALPLHVCDKDGRKIVAPRMRLIDSPQFSQGVAQLPDLPAQAHKEKTDAGTVASAGDYEKKAKGMSLADSSGFSMGQGNLSSLALPDDKESIDDLKVVTAAVALVNLKDGLK